jgi:precorrin-6B methylase 2
MLTSAAPSGHTFLDFNSPLSDARAAELIAGLRPLPGPRIVDLGCGWAELLLRLLEAEPSARGIGVDDDSAAIQRGRANAAARGLVGRVTLEDADATKWDGLAETVICIGATHAWGGPGPTLKAARSRLRPGGQLLLGDAIWEKPPTAEAMAALEAGSDEFPSLAGLVDLALHSGFRLLSLSVANADEWDSFESRWCAGRERWLLEHPDAPDAAEVRALVDEHRTGWLHGYRGFLGFAYLTLALPR